MNRMGLTLVATLVALSSAQACNVPVFRYALERWRPDTYQVYLFRDGPLKGEAKAAVERLMQHGPSEKNVANVEVLDIDLEAKPEQGYVDYYNRQGKPKLPWMTVRADNLDRNTVTIWSGTPSEDIVTKLLDSPARREIAKRLLAGETSVWVFLECGEPNTDGAAVGVLDKELKRLAGLLKLPVLTDDPADKLTAKGPPLKLAFSILRIAADDENEVLFKAMLKKSESGFEPRQVLAINNLNANLTMLLNNQPLAAVSCASCFFPPPKEAMTFPIFGRGRMMGGLLGEGVTPENIADGCRILIAPCSCKVKAQSAGFDLLMAMDWDTALDTGKLPDQPAFKPGKKAEPEKVPLPKPKEEKPRPEGREEIKEETSNAKLIPTPWIIGGISAAGVLVLLTGLWLFRSSAGT